MKRCDTAISDDGRRHWKDEEKTQEERKLEAAYDHVIVSERKRWVPAARCRECGVITWKLSLSGGRRRTGFAHRDGCSEPPGRFDR